MLNHSKRLLACLQHAGTVLVLLCFSPSASAMTVSPSPSYGGTYTVSWPAWGATGCTYTYNGPFLAYSCYILEEMAPGGGWTSVGTPDSSTSWTATGKAPGTYRYRLQYAYGDINYGGINMIDGPVSVDVFEGQPPPPPPPPPPGFQCNIVNKEKWTGIEVDISISGWYFDTLWWTAIPFFPPATLRHTTDNPDDC